jgi:hypothetical protein
VVEFGSLEVREEDTPETAARFDDGLVSDRDAAPPPAPHAVSITGTKINKAA